MFYRNPLAYFNKCHGYCSGTRQMNKISINYSYSIQFQYSISSSLYMVNFYTAEGDYLFTTLSSSKESLIKQAVNNTKLNEAEEKRLRSAIAKF